MDGVANFKQIILWKIILKNFKKITTFDIVNFCVHTILNKPNKNFMRLKLLMLLVLSAVLPAIAQNTGISGVVVDAKTGSPIAGASVMLTEQGIIVTTGPAGDFRISDAQAGDDVLAIVNYGYSDMERQVMIVNSSVSDLGTIELTKGDVSGDLNMQDDFQDLIFDESQLEEDEGTAQSVGALTGGLDNVYYNTASYDFNAMRFRMRGYNSEYQTTYVNGIEFNDLGRGRFNYSTLDGYEHVQLWLWRRRRIDQHQHFGYIVCSRF